MILFNMVENFKRIEGFENYFITESGNVYKENKDLSIKELKKTEDKRVQGNKEYFYQSVTLYNNGKKKRFHVHKLMELYFPKEEKVDKPLEDEVVIQSTEVKEKLNIVDLIIFAMGLILGHIITKLI